MKFDVLKGMVDKTMSRTAASGVVEDDEDKDYDMKERMADMQEQLSKTFTELTSA